MITEKDREIIKFIENIGFATINQIAKVFYSDVVSSYDSSRRELKKILRQGNYIRAIKNCETNQIVYTPIDSKLKKISKHDLLAIDYVTSIKELGAEIESIEIEKNFNGVIPDLFISFIFNKTRYYQLVEIQLRHDYVDINRFNSKMDVILAETNGYAPDVVIIQNTNKKYEDENTTPMKIIQIKTDLSDIPKVFI